MNAAQIDQFERIQSQLSGLYSEIEALSKKKPNDPLNAFKLGFVNQIISQANEMLGKKRRPFQNFEQFDEETLPTNSDVVLMLTQYLSCLESLRTENIAQKGHIQWYWIIDGEISSKKTYNPHY